MVNTNRKWNAGDEFLQHKTHLLILLVCAKLFGSKQNDHHSTHLYPPDTALCDLFIFPEPKMALKRRRINEITMIAAKSWDALGEFQAMHFTKWFKWWCERLAN